MSDASIDTVESSNDRGGINGAPSKQRSKISNGSFILGDQRSAWARRAKDVEASLIGDLGGSDVVSTAMRLVLRRIATMEVELNQRETSFAEQGSASDEALQVYSTIVNSQRRLLADIGLERKPRDITPSLSSYVSRKGSRSTIDADTSSGGSHDA